MLREWGVVELLKRQLRKNKSPSFLAVMKLVFKIQRSLSSFTPHWPFYPTTNTPQFPRPKKKNVRECQWSFKKKQTKASSRTSIPPKKKKHLLMFVHSPSIFFRRTKCWSKIVSRVLSWELPCFVQRVQFLKNDGWKVTGKLLGWNMVLVSCFPHWNNRYPKVKINYCINYCIWY